MSRSSHDDLFAACLLKQRVNGADIVLTIPVSQLVAKAEHRSMVGIDSFEPATSHASALSGSLAVEFPGGHSSRLTGVG